MHQTIRPATPDDCAAIADIYNHYVRETVITFEEEPVSSDEMKARLQAMGAATLPWLVAVRETGVVGYAYASQWKARSAYRHSVETTVYVDNTCTGQRIGTELYAVLFDALGTKGLHLAIGGIALPNAASVALHEKFGMKKVAHFSEVGFKFGRWIDVGYWQRRL